MGIGANIRAIRKTRKMTQEQLGEKAGYGSNVYISRLETEDIPNPTIETLRKIADVLDCTVQDLLAETETTSNPAA